MLQVFVVILDGDRDGQMRFRNKKCQQLTQPNCLQKVSLETLNSQQYHKYILKQ